MKRGMLMLCAVASVALASGCGGGGEKGPAATVATSRTTERTTTSTTLSPEAEVEAAYLKSWDVYTDAMRTFDTSKLGEVYADEALALRLDEVGDLRTANTPALMRVVHDFEVTVINDHQASVIDGYMNHSVLIDPVTGQPTEPDPNELVRSQYVITKIDGTWKIARVLAI